MYSVSWLQDHEQVNRSLLCLLRSSYLQRIRARETESPMRRLPGGIHRDSCRPHGMGRRAFAGQDRWHLSAVLPVRQRHIRFLNSAQKYLHMFYRLEGKEISYADFYFKCAGSKHVNSDLTAPPLTLVKSNIGWSIHYSFLLKIKYFNSWNFSADADW